MEVISQCTIYPSKPSTLGNLKLSVSDLPMLSCHYIQKGLLFPSPPLHTQHLLPTLLSLSLSHALTHFPALAGRLSTDPSDGTIFVSCNDAGVPFSHCTTTATSLTLPKILFSDTATGDVPDDVKQLLFEFDGAVSYDGHFRPLAAFRVTELADGSVFVACTVNHAVADGTSFWNFFNCWTELCRTGGVDVSRKPDFRRNFFGDSTAVLRVPKKGPEVTFDVHAPLRERILHFTGDAIRELKAKANNYYYSSGTMAAEIYGKQIHDERQPVAEAEISSFQSLCALLWKHVTRARKLPAGATTTFRMAMNCRHRVEPKVDAYYFGNAIQSVPTVALVAEVKSRELRWTAGILQKSVAAHVDGEVRRVVEDWEKAPGCFPLGNPDGSGLTMGSSPRFPMYDNEFGWGRPVAVRSGRANKFDGKVSAFPGREGRGSVDLEVCLAPEAMAALLEDDEFMQFGSQESDGGDITII